MWIFIIGRKNRLQLTVLPISTTERKIASYKEEFCYHGSKDLYHSKKNSSTMNVLIDLCFRFCRSCA
jgi:hypothetical protein